MPGEGVWLPNSVPVSWIWSHGVLDLVPGYMNLIPGALGLVPWLPSEGFRLPGFTSWLLGESFMVAWTLFHGFLVKVPGCLY